MDEPLSSLVPPRRRGFGCVTAFLGTVLILALLAGFIFYRLETLPLRLASAGDEGLARWANKVRDAFVAVTGMQPRVKVNEQVVYEQAGPILELAVLSREASVERETEDTWLGSTKHLRLRGLYRVKAGYDLKQPMTATIDGEHGDTVRVQMPAAKLLSVELEKLDVLTIDNGLWNHVQPEEFQQEVNLLNLEARRKAQDEHLSEEAQRLLTGQLQQKLGPERRVETIPAPTPAPERR